MTKDNKCKIISFCSYCRAQYSYHEWLLGFRYCPYDGFRLQDIKHRVPPLEVDKI